MQEQLKRYVIVLKQIQNTAIALFLSSMRVCMHVVTQSCLAAVLVLSQPNHAFY